MSRSPRRPCSMPLQVLAALGWLALAARCLAAPPDIRIYTDNDPPYVVADQDNRLSGGLAADKVLRVLQRLGLPPDRISVMPWARAYQEAKSRPGVLIFPIAKTRERLGYLDFTFKILDSDVYFYKLRPRQDIQLHSLADARRYSVCVVLNDYRHEYLISEGFSRLEATSDSTNNVRKFLNGRCDLLPATQIGMESKLQALGASLQQVERGLRLDRLDSALYAAFNKDTPPEIIARFRKAAEEDR